MENDVVDDVEEAEAEEEAVVLMGEPNEREKVGGEAQG